MSPNIPSPNVAKYSLPSLSPNSHQIFPHPLSQNIPSPHSHQIFHSLAFAKYSLPSFSLNTPSLRSRQILPHSHKLLPNSHQILPPLTFAKYSLPSFSPNIRFPHCRQIFHPLLTLTLTFDVRIHTHTHARTLTPHDSRLHSLTFFL